MMAAAKKIPYRTVIVYPTIILSPSYLVHNTVLLARVQFGDLKSPKFSSNDH